MLDLMVDVSEDSQTRLVEVYGPIPVSSDDSAGIKDVKMEPVITQLSEQSFKTYDAQISVYFGLVLEPFNIKRKILCDILTCRAAFPFPYVGWIYG